jgi:hypothetical protein
MPFGCPEVPDEKSTSPGAPRPRNSAMRALSLVSPRRSTSAGFPAESRRTYHSHPDTARATDSSTTEAGVRGMTTHRWRARARSRQNASGE